MFQNGTYCMNYNSSIKNCVAFLLNNKSQPADLYLCTKQDIMTIGDIVDEFMIERGYESRHQYARLLNMAIRGLKEIHYDVSGVSTWTQLELDNRNSATVPNGLINVIRMWINVNGYGMLEVVQTTKMVPTLINNEGEEVFGEKFQPEDAAADNIFDLYLTGTPHFQRGQFVGGIYKGVGSNPYVYRRNYDTNKFEFSSNVSAPILEYLTDPCLVDGKYEVHPLVQDAIMYWLHHADCRFKKYVSPSEKQFNQQRYVAAKNHSRLRMANITPGNMRAATRGSYSLTTK